MSDMLLSEPLHLLEKGDYVPFVRLIFTILRHVTRLKTIRLYSRPIARRLHLLLMSIPSIRQFAEKHHRFITDRVHERLTKSPEQPDIWSLVTAETSTAALISEEERYSIANELMIAGTETSATVLSGCLYHLLKNPAWMATLTKDIRDKYSPETPGGPDKITMAGLQANKLLDAVIKEAMRYFSHLSSTESEYNKLTLPSDSTPPSPSVSPASSLPAAPPSTATTSPAATA